MMNAEHVQRIQKAIGNTRNDLALMNEAREELLVALLEKPDDTELHGQLDQTEAEITGLQRQIERLETTMTAAKKADTAIAREREQARLAALATQYSAELEARVDATESLMSKWGEVLDLLKKVEGHTHAATDAAKDCGLMAPLDQDRFVVGVGAAMAAEACLAGFFGKLEYVEFRRPLGNDEPIAGTARRLADHAKLRVKGRRHG